MCMCEKPNVNGEQGYSWDGKQVGVRKPAPPQLTEDDKVLFDEPGRCGGDDLNEPGRRGAIDSHCHHYMVVKNIHHYLLVSNGSGDHRIRLASGRITVKVLEQLDSDARYWMLNSINHAASEAERKGASEADQRWRQAAAEKRIKTRKRRNQESVKVWIEPELTPA